MWVEAQINYVSNFKFMFIHNFKNFNLKSYWKTLLV
ncbi:hypothetical protein [Elizabethkingia anophelis]